MYHMSIFLLEFRNSLRMGSIHDVSCELFDKQM